MDKILVSRKQAAKFLGVSTNTVDRRIKKLEELSPSRYEMPVIRTKGCVRINLLCLIDYMGYENFFEAGMEVPPFKPGIIAKELAFASE